MLIFYSDEKNFTQDQKVNRKNNRWLCSDPTDVPIVMSTKFPKTVMVLGVVSNKGDVMPPHVFEAGLRVNAPLIHQISIPWTFLSGARLRGTPTGPLIIQRSL